ncbi:putative Ig domain-containing protein [Phenylobacterium sp.]|uniref:putative Ig domain-containing protein n=1 Tax=Phenylobacterium sp. TaxID=1871053 RepID=UPI00272F3DA6|nr:putative Ig domain-containing protein [Phenylobacterium sp.]MDP1599028.1 putative Ig domain-containing protein [Phenylobacterium sp.]MDP3590456.1 putative Ig domain-containing protein [Phenylobacterium sp.]
MSLRIGIGLGLIPTAARPAATTAPVNVVKPFFEGPLTQGQSAAVNPGSWTGLPSPNFTYAIKRGATTVSTSPTYVWTSADVAAGAGAMTVAVTATNDVGPTTATSDPVTIAAPLQLAGSPPAANVGAPYLFAPTRTGGNPPFAFSLTGTLQTGLTFEGETGEISGTPVSSGTASLVIGVTDSDGLTASLGPFDLVVGTASSANFPRLLNNTAINGSSTSAGDNDGSGKSFASYLADDTPGSTKAILGSPVSSEAAGGSTDVAVTAQVNASTDKSATRIIQTDLLMVSGGWNSASNVGSPEQRRNWLKNSILPLLNAGVTAQGRLLSWAGTEYGWGGVSFFREYRMSRLMWADRPGFVANSLRYWMVAPPLDSTDTAAINNGEIPPSYQVADRSHPNDKGIRYLEQAFVLPFQNSVEAGLPFFPMHRYFSNRSTAQTNGGAVCQLYFSGSLSGCSLALVNLDGSPNTDFAISSSAAVTRSSATVLKRGYYDLLVRVTRAGLMKEYRIGLGIGSIDLSNDDEMFVDGNTWASIDSVDNAGTLDAPSYVNGTSRNFRGVPGGQKQFSLAVRLHPDASTDGQILNIYHQGGGVQLTRQAAGGIRIAVRDDAGATYGQLTGGSTPPTGQVSSVNGRRWVFYSANVESGVLRHRLMVVDDVTGATVFDSGAVAVNAARTSFAQNPLASSGLTGIFHAPSLGTSGIYKGKIARFWISNKEVDWTVAANVATMRASAGVVTDLGAAAGNIVGDGRSVTITAGAAGSYAGVLTPYFLLSGNGADYMEGINHGSGAGLGGAAPANAAYVGGIGFETVDRRDWSAVVPTQGLAITQ